VIAFFLLTYLTFGPVLPTVEYDLFEVNEKLDAEGEVQYTQLIFWDWDMRTHRFQSHGFVMLRGNLPKREQTGFWVLTCRDSGNVRRVVSRACAFSRTFHDPEVKNKEDYPNVLRKGPFHPLRE